jgi:hypothetical protein
MLTANCACCCFCARSPSSSPPSTPFRSSGSLSLSRSSLSSPSFYAPLTEMEHDVNSSPLGRQSNSSANRMRLRLSRDKRGHLRFSGYPAPSQLTLLQEPQARQTLHPHFDARGRQLQWQTSGSARPSKLFPAERAVRHKLAGFSARRAATVPRCLAPCSHGRFLPHARVRAFCSPRRFRCCIRFFFCLSPSFLLSQCRCSIPRTSLLCGSVIGG